MIRKLKYIICFVIYSYLFSADCTCCLVEEYFNENISYYPFSFFNSSSLGNQPLLFKYGTQFENCPENLVVSIAYRIYAPSIGINSYQNFFTGEIVIDENSPIIYFTNNSIQSSIKIDVLGNKKLESLFSYISKSGSMPNGQYQINISLKNNNKTIFNVPTKTFEIDIPNTLELLYPGSTIENISNSYIFNINPLFNWYTDYCQLCEYSIRISEYNKDEHNSLEEALNDWSLIPSDQSKKFYDLGSMAQSFQYPSDGYLNLEEGKYYVWQIKRSFNKHFQIQNDFSDIYIFEIRSVDKVYFSKSNKYLEVIESIIEVEKFNLLFGPGGKLESFAPSTDYIELNGEIINIEALYSILSELESGKAKLDSIKVQ